MVTIVTGTSNKPASSEALKDYFRSHPEYCGYLYLGYPIIGTVNGAYSIDAIWVSEEKGLIVFNLLENRDLDNYWDVQDDCYNKLEAKLKNYRQLTDRRVLCVNISTITFAPAYSIIPAHPADYPLCNENTLGATLDKIIWQNNTYYSALLSVLQSVTNIRKSKKRRELTSKDSRGTKLLFLEQSIATLDNLQSRAVIETVEGVQRIRGLAGSGKTIVLALKAAYLHAQHPEWKIAVTFNTRSLKGQFRQLINTFYIEQTNEEPDWGNLQIIHAWGSPGSNDNNGLYYIFCKNYGVEYLDYLCAKSRYGRDQAFTKACEVAINTAKNILPLYDAILIDEAQDFSPSFLQLCYELLKEPKRLVYAYDELQSLNSQFLPSPEEIFGVSEDGYPRVKFGYQDAGKPQQDIILEKCYRNSRPALVTAHALGFGIYRKIDSEIGTGIVQMFEHNELWKDIGYEVVEGDLIDGDVVRLQRTTKSSPEFLETHSPIDDLILFKRFNTIEEQNAWVADEIAKNLHEDELRADDIIVINPDPLTTRGKLAPIREMLYKKNIASHIAGVDTSPDVFFDNSDDSVAFTGINRAKGNEAAMVYVVNAQDCYSGDMAKIRNQLFTAITRSKAWVRILGVGSNMAQLMQEYKKVKDNNYTLYFTYPTEPQRKHMNIVNRDMSSDERAKISKRRINLAELIKDLEEQKVFPEDLGPEQIRRLRKLLLKQED